MNRIFGLLLLGLFFIGLPLFPLGCGLTFLHDSLAERAVARLPLTPLADVGSHVGQVVRVQGVSAGPFLNGGPAGLDLTKVVIEELTSKQTFTVYDAWAPQQFQLRDGQMRDGQTSVGVVPENVNDYFLDEHGPAGMQADGSLYSELASWVDTSVFTDIPKDDRSDRQATVWTIPKGAALTVCGLVARKNGQLVLQAPPHSWPSQGGDFIISGWPYPKLAAKANLHTKVGFSFGIVGTLIGVFLLLFSLRALLRDRKKKQADSLPPPAGDGPGRQPAP